MSTALIIVIVIAALVVIAAIAVLLRHRAAEREIEHERLSGEAVAHRDQADANVSRARERGREADVHRRQVRGTRRPRRGARGRGDRARREGRGTEQQVRTAGEAAAFHREAAEREDKLERP